MRVKFDRPEGSSRPAAMEVQYSINGESYEERWKNESQRR